MNDNIRTPGHPRRGPALDHTVAYLAASAAAISSIDPEAIAQAIGLIESTRANGGTVWTLGNGGNATIAAHLSLGLTLNTHRTGGTPVRSGCLSTDAALLTAAMNDFGSESTFARQLQLVGRRGDAVIALSVSGASPNVVSALATARHMGLTTIGIIGDLRSPAKKICDHVIGLGSTDPALGEDAAQVIVHSIYCWFMTPLDVEGSPPSGRISSSEDGDPARLTDG